VRRGAFARVRRLWRVLGRVRSGARQRRPVGRAVCGVPGDLVVGDQIGPVPFRRAVFGIGDQEIARLGELVRVPAGVECALPENQVHVAAFPHAQADPHVHLRPDSRAFARREQIDDAGHGRLSLDGLTRQLIRGSLGYRFTLVARGGNGEGVSGNVDRGYSSLKERAGVKPEMSWGYACGLLFLGRRDWRSLFP
jgi:hypothetical protein